MRRFLGRERLETRSRTAWMSGISVAKETLSSLVISLTSLIVPGIRGKIIKPSFRFAQQVK